MYCPPNANTNTNTIALFDQQQQQQQWQQRRKKRMKLRSWENDEKKSIKQQAHKIPNEKKDGEKTLFQLIYKRNFLIRCAKQHNPIYGCSVFSSGSFFFEHWTMFNSPLNSIFLRLCIFFLVGQSISDTWDNVFCFVHLQCECSKTSLWTAIKSIRAQNEDGNG